MRDILLKFCEVQFKNPERERNKTKFIEPDLILQPNYNSVDEFRE